MSFFDMFFRRWREQYELEDYSLGASRRSLPIGVLAEELREALQKYIELLYDLCYRGVRPIAFTDRESYISALVGFIQGFFAARCGEIPLIQFTYRDHNYILELRILKDYGNTLLTLQVNHHYKPPRVYIML